MFFCHFPVSLGVAWDFGDTDWTGRPGPVATYLAGSFDWPGRRSCPAGGVEPVCLGIERLEFFFGLAGAGIRMADFVCRVGSSSHFLYVSGAAIDDDGASPMAMAHGPEADGS